MTSDPHDDGLRALLAEILATFTVKGSIGSIDNVLRSDWINVERVEHWRRLALRDVPADPPNDEHDQMCAEFLTGVCDCGRVPVEPPEPSAAETRAALKAWRDAGNGGVDHGAAMIAALRAAWAVRSSVPADNPQGES